MEIFHWRWHHIVYISIYLQMIIFVAIKFISYISKYGTQFDEFNCKKMSESLKYWECLWHLHCIYEFCINQRIHRSSINVSTFQMKLINTHTNTHTPWSKLKWFGHLYIKKNVYYYIQLYFFHETKFNWTKFKHFLTKLPWFDTSLSQLIFTLKLFKINYFFSWFAFNFSPFLFNSDDQINVNRWRSTQCTFLIGFNVWNQWDQLVLKAFCACYPMKMVIIKAFSLHTRQFFSTVRTI